MDEFLYLALFFEQNVAMMSSFWGSAPATPCQHVGHGAQAKLKQWVNLMTKPYQAIAWVDAGLAASGWESDGARDSERAFPRN